jgi:hypothetical protein
VLVGSVIFLNTLLLSFTTDELPNISSSALFAWNVFVSIFFIVEMLITLAAIGWQEYRSSKLHLLDGFVGLISVADLVLTFNARLQSPFVIDSFRSVRLLRLFRLFRPWTALFDLFDNINKSLTDIGYFSLLVLVYLFIMGLLGVTIFRGKLVFKGVRSRNHFDNIGWAMYDILRDQSRCILHRIFVAVCCVERRHIFFLRCCCDAQGHLVSMFHA